METKSRPLDGQLRVWWIPQVPMKRFTVDVESLAEAKKILRVLADYDRFQFENNVKGDYCNAGGLVQFSAADKEDSSEGSWSTWYDDETGADIDKWAP